MNVLILLLAALPVVPAVRSEKITDCKLPSEGYRIRVGADGQAQVEAADAAGRFYAEQTLAQLPKPLKPCEIEDWPTYPHRAVLVDDARLCYGKDGVKKIIDQMSKVKLNVFHWHFIEPGAWRMMVPGYEKVSEKLPREKRYSREDMREIVDYAAARHVRVMPEIEMPGHNNAESSYPEFKHGEPPSFGNVCPANPETIRFFKAALTEAAAVFPETMIHFGGDEVNYASWKKCKRCQAKIRELGLASEADLQAWFMSVMADHLKSLGKTPVGWSDMLLTLNEGNMRQNEKGYWTGYGIRRNLSKDIVINAWYGDWECEGGCGAVAANLGYKVIQYPSNHAYFDHGQGLDGDTHKYSYTNALTLRDAYEWNPVSDVRPECRANVIGVGCANWGEKATDLKALEWKLWPRGFATAEVGWGTSDRDGFREFCGRAKAVAKIFRECGVNVAPVTDPEE